MIPSELEVEPHPRFQQGVGMGSTAEAPKLPRTYPNRKLARVDVAVLVLLGSVQGDGSVVTIM